MEEIGPEFFRRPPQICARELIGCLFRWNGCVGRIVETEAYAEFGDPACHTWNRPSAREFISNHEAGTAYVYLNYGVHWLFNILTKSEQCSGFVLFRALEPIKGLEKMRMRRGDLAGPKLCSGPGKLTKAFGINGQDHGMEFLNCGENALYYGDSGIIRVGGRIGISRATDFPWRFGAADSACLSAGF